MSRLATVRSPARRGPHRVPAEALLVFAPLHKLAFGIAVGTAVGSAIFLLTGARLLLDPSEVSLLGLLAQYFYGYEESWRGAFVGAAWGFGVGFVAGWFVAFCRNLAIATWFFITRTRAQLESARSFLDHV